MARRVKRPGGGARRPRATEEQFYAEMRAAYAPELAERVLALYEYAKARGSRQNVRTRQVRKRRPSGWARTRTPRSPIPLAVRFGASDMSRCTMRHFRLAADARGDGRASYNSCAGCRGRHEALDEAVAKDYRTFCTSLRTRCSPPTRISRRSSASSTRRRFAPRQGIEWRLPAEPERAVLVDPRDQSCLGCALSSART